jgi:aspartate aminotransferase-like enzyme
MGYIDTVDLIGTIAGLEEVLKALGYEVKPGVGVTAAQEILTKEAGA